LLQCLFINFAAIPADLPIEKWPLGFALVVIQLGPERLA
jgi:hypothetical protein